jgi:peptide-methionine (S)-S-oxide reductase
VVRIVFDPKLISYKKLLQVFFTIHDPTTKDQQWADKGPQYASVVFYHTSEQHAIVDAVIASLEAENVFEKNIVTRVKKAETFWIAESYHQNYYQWNSWTMYCAMVIGPKINKLRQDWKELLKQES